MSGPKSRQQQSRSPKGKVNEPEVQAETPEKFAGHEASFVVFDDIYDGIEPDETTDQNGDGSSEDEGDEEDGIDS